MRSTIEALEGKTFDVVVIGSGVNGASAAQQLSAAGYTVALLDKEDFGSGASSRSGRILHCGLRYLAPGDNIWEFLWSPEKLVVALRMARQSMISRAQFVKTAPERVDGYSCAFPIYHDDSYSPWQVRLTLNMLRQFGPRDVPLEFKWYPDSQLEKLPLVRLMSGREKMLGAASYREFRFHWPERICMDMVMDAERMGAVVRNYSPVSRLERLPDGSWSISVRDALNLNASATLKGRVVLNMAGVWIDEVNAKSGRNARRYINGTKGVHILVELPPECTGQGLYTFSSDKEPLSCVPWGRMHAFGATETIYRDDIDDVRPLDEDLDWLIFEANRVFSGLSFTRENIIFAWAGVRPLGEDPAFPKGRRLREVHDLSDAGLPGVFAMTAGPVMTHRSAGVELLDQVRKRIAPSGETKALQYAARRFSADQTRSPNISGTTVSVAEAEELAATEHPVSLVDLLFRRVNVGWTPEMGYDVATAAAQQVAPIFGWNAERVQAEAKNYRSYIEQNHRWNRGHKPVVLRS